VTSFRNANNLFDIGEIVERGLEFSFSFGGMAVLSSRVRIAQDRAFL
jgi:hypothetical protein